MFVLKQLYILNNRLHRSNNFKINDLINILTIILLIVNRFITIILSSINYLT